ncbi:MAG: phosphonopyruvate decarboxylase [Candidatus Paceibacterota bacterium]
MISSHFFLKLLLENDVNLFTGVPDSLLKDFCEHIDVTLDPSQHIIAANEGSALGIAAGHHLATGKVPLIYMQNSGLGNAVNPLTSLLDEKVYCMPALLLIGWRGEPGVSDEPQHITMGEVTPAVLNAINVPHTVLSSDEKKAAKELLAVLDSIKKTCRPHALLVRKGTFSAEKHAKPKSEEKYTLTREQALTSVVEEIPKNSVIVSTTGKLSRELFEIRHAKSMGHACDFLTIGSMGHASQIALGLALSKPNKNIYCFDGDGAAIMHLGGMATIGQFHPSNFVHIVFNNGAHESVGGQKTAGFFVNFCEIARACGYKEVYYADTDSAISQIFKDSKPNTGPIFIEIRTKKGARSDLGRPTIPPNQNKKDLMEFLNKK